MVKRPVEWEWRCPCGEVYPDLRCTKIECHRCGRSATHEPYLYLNCNALWCACIEYIPDPRSPAL